MSGWEIMGILAVAAVPSVLCVAATVWFCARVVKRVHDTNRDLLKAALVARESPPASQLAAAMEVTDRVEIERERHNVPMQRRVPAGAS